MGMVGPSSVMLRPADGQNVSAWISESHQNLFLWAISWGEPREVVQA